jgi:2-keto-4-pentenoate hydratase/2-oxohepta-3-ene-1,7-dioic acid hydratase in catechol pathway
MSETSQFARVATPEGDRFARVQHGRALLLDGAPWNDARDTGESISLADAHLLCPVAPRQIFGIGKNYRAHASEMGSDVPAEPLVFLKAVSSLVGPEGPVVLPPESVRVDHEAELGVVIGRRCRRVTAARALDHVFGYTVLCDVTARDLQARDGQWARAKSFDTFCPVGPFVVTGLDPSPLGLRLTVNGETRQSASTAQMVFDVARLVAHVSSFATLEPGDLIATGTPDGVGPLAEGDRVIVSLERVGDLRFGVVGEPGSGSVSR